MARFALRSRPNRRWNMRQGLPAVFQHLGLLHRRRSWFTGFAAPRKFGANAPPESDSRVDFDGVVVAAAEIQVPYPAANRRTVACPRGGGALGLQYVEDV